MDAGETLARLIILGIWSAVWFGIGRATAPLTGPREDFDDFSVHLPPPPKGMPEYCWQRKNGSLPKP